MHHIALVIVISSNSYNAAICHKAHSMITARSYRYNLPPIIHIALPFIKMRVRVQHRGFHFPVFTQPQYMVTPRRDGLYAAPVIRGAFDARFGPKIRQQTHQPAFRAARGPNLPLDHDQLTLSSGIRFSHDQTVNRREAVSIS